MKIAVHTLTLGMAQAYLIESADGLVLVDAGSPGHAEKVLAKVNVIGQDNLRLIFITHAHLDHYGSAAAVRRLTGAPIAIHKADAEAMSAGDTILGTARGRGKLLPPLMGLARRFMATEPTPPDVVLEDDDLIADYGLNGRVLHTPGHTVGSSSLIIDGKMAFVGDLMTSRGQPRLQRLYAQDWSALAASLERIKQEDPDLLYPGHGRHTITNSQLHNLSVI